MRARSGSAPGRRPAVDPRALELGLRQPELLALAVDAQQRGRELGEQPQRRGLIVDEDAVAAGAADLAAHHQLAAVGLEPGLLEQPR